MPFYLTAVLNLSIGGCIVIKGTDEQRDIYSKSARLGGLTIAVAALLGGLGSRRQRKAMGGIALQIAQAEGRKPKDLNFERNRTVSVLSVFSTLTTDGSTPQLKRQVFKTALARSLDNRTRKLAEGLDRKQRELIFSQAEQMLKIAGADPQTGRSILHSAYTLSEEYWSNIANNPKQPDHRRRYAYRMVREIRNRSSK